MDTSKIIQANKLRRMRWSWDSIAHELGVSRHAIQYACDAEFAEKHREKNRNYAKKTYKRVRPYTDKAPGLSVSKVSVQSREAVRVPQDVLFEAERAMQAPRSLTALAFGDPTFERSALGRRQLQAGK